MLRYCLVFAVVVSVINAGCPSISSVYNTKRVKCPTCSFLDSSKAVSGGGSSYKLQCPSDHEVWYYNTKGQEFVTPIRAMAGAQLKCSGSRWVLVNGGSETELSAFACARE